jgi:hypothetical protein
MLADKHMLIGAVGCGDPLTEYALSARLDMMRAEIVGENPTPLEALLTEQVVSCRLWLQLLDTFLSGQFQREFPAGRKRVGMPHLLKLVRFQESAQRRFLAAIKARTSAKVASEYAWHPIEHTNQCREVDWLITT